MSSDAFATWPVSAVLLLLHISRRCCPLLCPSLQVGNYYNYARLTSAGWIITTIANFCITFLLGWRPRKIASSSG